MGKAVAAVTVTVVTVKDSHELPIVATVVDLAATAVDSEVLTVVVHAGVAEVAHRRVKDQERGKKIKQILRPLVHSEVTHQLKSDLLDKSK